MADNTSTSSVLNPLLIGAGLLVAWNFLKKGVSSQSLIFLPGQVKGVYFDGITPYITVGIIVQNTSNQNYTIRSLAGNVTANKNGSNYNIGNLSTFTPQYIYGNSQRTIWVDLRLSLIGIVSDILNSYQEGISQTIKFSGNANVENVQVPIEFIFTI